MSLAKIKRTTVGHRALDDLISIGPATLRDFKLLGVNSVAELARQKPEKLFAKLRRVTGQRQDICVLDTFRAGVAQARNPRLPAKQCQWWYWSRRRKASHKRQAS
jgi:nucleotidyltransferase/DNA polymerase involved in DNA repair